MTTTTTTKRAERRAYERLQALHTTGELTRTERRLLARCRRLVQPPPKLTVSQWADAHRRLSAEASSEPGRWKTRRAEYQRAMMDAVSDRDVQRVVIMSSAQIGKTELVLNVLGYHMDQDPAPILTMQPTLNMAKTFSKDRVATMVRDTPRLREKVKESRTRDSGNTLLHKSFPGGHLTITGANSAADLASRPIRFVLCDEVDRYPPSAGSEGDPVELAIKRTITFHNRKIVLVSTPTLKNHSRIEKAFLESDQRYFHVPCPHCGFEHRLEWKNIKWDPGAPQAAYAVCPDCGGVINDQHKKAMLRNGRWIATQPFKGVAGFHLSALYSPWRKFGDSVKAFLEARKLGRDGLQVFSNTELGETWEDEAGEYASWEQLLARAEPYRPLFVPPKGLLLTAGVDVQDNRLAVKVKAWGVGEESWLVYWGEIYGDPAGDAVWQELDELLQRDYEHASGKNMRITATAIDSGGHHTQRVYAYARDRKSWNVIAIRGSSQPGQAVRGKPSSVDLDHRGRKIKNGAEVWMVGTDTAKSLIYARMKAPDIAAKMHFYVGLDAEYFMQLTAEKRVTRLHKGFTKMEWVKTRPRNEALDCEVYALAAAYHAGIQRVNWSKLTEKYSVLPSEISEDIQKSDDVPTDDALEKMVATPEPVQREARRPNSANRRPGGWVNGWKGRY